MSKAISRLKEFNFSGRLSVIKPIESFISKRIGDMRLLINYTNLKSAICNLQFFLVAFKIIKRLLALIANIQSLAGSRTELTHTMGMPRVAMRALHRLMNGK